jgi:uncharacterized protein (TIGR00255 family)
MPVYSMTGYASGHNGAVATQPEAEIRPSPAGRLGVEIRSVNSRFLDLAFKLPDEFRQHEGALRELLSGRLKRGKIEVRAWFDAGVPVGVPEPSVRLLQRLNGVQDSIRAWLPTARELSVADVLRLAAGTEVAGRGEGGSELLDVVRKTVEGLLAAREREGARLGEVILSHVRQLRALAAWAAPLIPKLVEQQRLRFLGRWQEAMGLTGSSTLPEAAQDRALSEATAFAIRIDVAEELARLDSHLDEIERLLGKGGELGKRLDFLIQELHREANTLGSKSAALELTHIGVDMKVLIEQMREQVQNIE